MSTDRYRRKVNANGDSSKRVILINNFLGGLAWGLGTVIGASVIVGGAFWILSRLHYIPGIGDLFPQNIEINSYK